MPSFRFLLVSLLSAIGASCAIAAQRDNVAQRAYATQRPNIVLVFIDDMAWGDLSCFGGEGPESQNIDRLASEGIRFEQFYVNAPICSPSRCAITTGQYPQRWRINSYLDNRQQNRRRGIANWLDPEAPTLAKALSGNGYVCGHFGKWHLGGQRNVRNAPLITQYGFEESLTNFEGLGARILPLNDAYDGSGPQLAGAIRWDDPRWTQAFDENSAVSVVGLRVTMRSPPIRSFRTARLGRLAAH